MIGRWLAGLTPEMEHDVLTERMGPGDFLNRDGTRCLLGVVGAFVWDGAAARKRRYYSKPPDYTWSGHCMGFGNYYDALCHRFGTARVNQFIRARILRNRLRRTLQASESSVTPSEVVHEYR